MYTGNLGHTSSIETVLDAAQLQSLSDVRFVIIGEGVKKNSLVQRVTHSNLANVSILPYQPRENLGDVLASADVCVVTLNEASVATSLPLQSL